MLSNHLKYFKHLYISFHFRDNRTRHSWIYEKVELEQTSVAALVEKEETDMLRLLF